MRFHHNSPGRPMRGESKEAFDARLLQWREENKHEHDRYKAFMAARRRILKPESDRRRPTPRAEQRKPRTYTGDMQWR